MREQIVRVSARKQLLIVVVAALLLSAQHLVGGSATWASMSISGDWNDTRNWTPATVPNTSADIASFGLSRVTSLFLSSNTEVGALAFNPDAAAYTINASAALMLTMSGPGIINASGTTQTFTARRTRRGTSA